MQIQAYPSSILKKMGWCFDGTVPSDDTPSNEIDYYDVLILEPTPTRKERVLIIQVTPEYGEVMGVSAEALEEFCKGHNLLNPADAVKVYYFDNTGDFGDQYSATRLLWSKPDTEWYWFDKELPMKDLAADVGIPTYVLTEMLEVFA